MITKSQADQLIVLTKRLIKAEVVFSELGMQPPTDWDDIILERDIAAEQLHVFIKKLQEES